MISYLLIAGIAYGIAYWISSTGMALWRAVVSFLIALVVGWLGGTLVSVFLISTFLAQDTAATTFNLLGPGFWLATTGAGFGVYRARYKLRTGQNAPSLKIPRWISMSALAVLVTGIVAAVALPAYQDYTKRQASATNPFEDLGKQSEAATVASVSGMTDAIAQIDLGLMYYKGDGVAQNSVEARRWFRLAATQGNADAQYNLGVMCYQGEGGAQDYAEALRWYGLAASQGNPRAQYTLAMMYEGGRGVAQDYVEALRWLRLAAVQGHADAQYNLGVGYATGRGVAQDYVEALRWFRMAAVQGHADAQYNLGVGYATGRGVAQDAKRAHLWLNLGAVDGQADKVKRRDAVAKKMTPQQIAQAQQMARDCQQRNFKNCY